jgi:hypothetical protein
VFRSRATRVHRQVTMPDPARRAAERQREAAREAERRAKERAAAAAALIERDGAVGRSRQRDGGKRKARVSTAQPSSDAMMPAPRRLAVEFGSGNDELPPPSSERRPRAGGSGGGSGQKPAERYAAARRGGGSGRAGDARARHDYDLRGRPVGRRPVRVHVASPRRGAGDPRGRADARRGDPRRGARRAGDPSRGDDGGGDARRTLYR